jgi:hypothetical protein
MTLLSIQLPPVDAASLAELVKMQRGVAPLCAASGVEIEERFAPVEFKLDHSQARFVAIVSARSRRSSHSFEALASRTFCKYCIFIVWYVPLATTTFKRLSLLGAVMQSLVRTSAGVAY